MDQVLKFESPSTINFHLNRPSALNSLNTEMIMYLKSQMPHCSKSLLFTGEGRAFCAGGDMVVLATHKASISEFFRNEFLLFFEISCLAQEKFAVLDGITMGGGVGLSMACNNRIATNKTVWAMPETAIGFCPDVGASYFLNKLVTKPLGLYLALTGDRLIGPDCFFAGVSNLYVPEFTENIKNNIFSLGGVDFACFNNGLDSEKSEILRNLPIINQCFDTCFSVETIFNRLASVNSEWSEKTLGAMQEMCPLSLKIAKQSFVRGDGLSYFDALDKEFDITIKLTEDTPYNFETSIVHKFVNKKKTRPDWLPRTLSEISDYDVEKYFDNQKYHLINHKI